MSKEENHNAISIGDGMYALAWDIRCSTCESGQKHFSKEYTKKELAELLKSK